MKVIQNTYPETKGIPYAKPGDIVNWEPGKRCYSLVRESDGRTVFLSPDVDKEGLRSNGDPPTLIGIIGQIKSKGWIFELSD